LDRTDTEAPDVDLQPFIFRQEGSVVAVRAAAAGDGLVEEVNQFALRPLTRDEFAVFTLDLCNNRIDRHHSRFPEEELDAINKMAPGRPLMERHDLTGSLPRGTFFRSQLHRAGDVLSVRPDVYVLRTRDNSDFILNIEGGVYRDTSIGFAFRTPECSVCAKDLRACSHVPGRSYGDDTCHYIMRGVLEVIEGSIVPSGSQGTRFVAQQRALAPAEALDAARREYHRPIELAVRGLWAEE
jgi:hypothetical protein